MVSTLKKKASENAPGRALAMPRPCPSVRLQRVSQLLSLMSVTDERRIGYCGGNQCSGPGGLPLSVVLALVGCAPAAVGPGQAPNVPHQQDEPRDTSGMR